MSFRSLAEVVGKDWSFGVEIVNYAIVECWCGNAVELLHRVNDRLAVGMCKRCVTLKVSVLGVYRELWPLVVATCLKELKETLAECEHARTIPRTGHCVQCDEALQEFESIG